MCILLMGDLMNIKKLKVLGFFIAFVLSFLVHFLYDLFPYFITSIFAPVNESIWEHMKILFTCLIVSGVVQKIIVILKKEEVNNVCFSNFIGSLLSIPIFLLIYLPLYYIVGENLFISIFIMAIVMGISEVISYVIMKRKHLGLENYTILFVVICYSLFTVLSYYPLKIDIFKDPITSQYGINK